MEENNVVEERVSIDRLSKVPIMLAVEVGNAKLTLEEVMKLTAGSIVPLNKLNSDPFDIKVNGHRVAEGQLVQHEGQFYVKVINILNE